MVIVHHQFAVRLPVHLCRAMMVVTVLEGVMGGRGEKYNEIIIIVITVWYYYVVPIRFRSFGTFRIGTGLVILYFISSRVRDVSSCCCSCGCCCCCCGCCCCWRYDSHFAQWSPRRHPQSCRAPSEVTSGLIVRWAELPTGPHWSPKVLGTSCLGRPGRWRGCSTTSDYYNYCSRKSKYLQSLWFL